MNSEGLKRRLEALRVQRARSGPRRRGPRGPGGRACQRRRLLRAAEGVVRQTLLPLRQAGGELHGPYWYHYWKTDKKTKRKYLGKNGPAEGA